MSPPRLSGLDPQQLRQALAVLETLDGLTEIEQARQLAALARDQPILALAVGQMLAAQARADATEGGPAAGLDGQARPRGVEAVPSRAEEALPLPKRIGPYRVQSLLGSGGMSLVYAAVHEDSPGQRVVAVKVLRPELVSPALRQRFQREQALQERLTHAHIAQVFDAGLDAQGLPYLVMERVEGEPITDHAQARALGLEARLRLVLQAAEAVSHAHARLIVHRDLKPSNILVDRQGRVKLLDFGIAKWLEGEGAGEATELTRAAGRAFTPDYAAPEQVLGDRITVATDVHALGVLLFELLTGQRPVDLWAARGLGPLQALTQQEAPRASTVARDAALRRALRGDLDAVVARALARLPEERYPSVATLAEDLQNVLAHRPVQARASSWGDRSLKFVRRNPLAVALSVALVLAGGVGVAATLWQAERTTLQAARADAVRDFLLSLFRAATPEESQDQPPSARDLAAEGERRLSTDQRLPEAARAELLGVLAEVWMRTGEPQRSIPLLRQRIALLQRGAPSGETLALAHAALGNALYFNDQVKEAEAVWHAALGPAERQREAGGTAWLQIRQGLVNARVQRGQAQEGLIDMLALMQDLSRSPLRDGPVMAQFMNDLGDVYFQASREEDALQAFGQAIAYDEAHPDGPAARDIREQLLSRSNRVYTRWGLCDLEGARQDSAELRGVLAQRLGQRHALLLNQTRLGVMVANELARYDEALALIERQLPLVDRSKPEWGKWHVAFLSDRALAWAHSGKSQAAAALAQDQIDFFLADQGPEAYGAEIAAQARMDALIALGQTELARAEGARLWAVFQQRWRPIRQSEFLLRRAVAAWPDRAAVQAHLQAVEERTRQLAPREMVHGRLCALRAWTEGVQDGAVWQRCESGLQALPPGHPARQTLADLRAWAQAGRRDVPATRLLPLLY